MLCGEAGGDHLILYSSLDRLLYLLKFNRKYANIEIKHQLNRRRPMLKPGDIAHEKYRVVEIIGEGSYGRVYLVESLSLPRTQWALKEMEEASLPVEERDDALELFKREAEILCSLHHAGLPSVVDFYSQGGCHYIVMEYVKGESLEEIMKKKGGAFSFKEVIPWATELAGILEFLHSRQPHPLIFRDLKPSNIMLTTEGRIKLIDFGIARNFNPQKTKDTFFMGTPGFSPPEQYGSGQSDPRSDIFSFGATLYHLLCNADMAHLNFSYPSLSKYSPGFPDWLDKVVLKCLSKNPGERYQKVSQILHDLQNKTFGKEESDVSSASVATSSIAGGRSPMGIWPGFYCIIAFLAILAIMVGLKCGNYRDLAREGLGCSTQIFLVIALIVAFTLRNRYKYSSWHNSIIWCNLSIAMIVLFLIGSVLFPNYLRAREDGMMTECKSNLKKCGKALELYSIKHAGSFPEKLEHLSPEYMKSLPTCPASKRIYGYMHESTLKSYTVFCRGNNHVPINADDYPRYDNVEGLYEH